MSAFTTRIQRNRQRRQAARGERGVALLAVRAATHDMPQAAVERLAGLDPADRLEFWDGYDDDAAGLAVLRSRIVTRIVDGELRINGNRLEVCDEG